MEDRLKSLLGEILDLEAGAIGEDFDKEDSPVWDSLNHLRLVTALEEEFQVKFSMEEVPKLTSFAAILSQIQQSRLR